MCTNASANFRPLLPRKVALTLTTQTVKRNGYAPSEAAAACAEMPAIIVKGGDGAFGDRTDSTAGSGGLDACYILPPLSYGPDSETLDVKVGHGSYFERDLGDEAAVLAWYEDRHVEERQDSFARCELQRVNDRLIRPPLVPAKTVTDRCVIPKTTTGRPYVHKFHESLGCCVGCPRPRRTLRRRDGPQAPFLPAFLPSQDDARTRDGVRDVERKTRAPETRRPAGNGVAAKSSDELGRLAARMMTRDWTPGDWDSPDIPPTAFDIVFDDS